MRIDGKELGTDSCYIVAELGHNHGGDLDTAEKMIRVAAKCGVDAVKLQKRSVRTLYTKAFFNTAYNSENAYGPTYGAHREALELTWADYQRLMEVAQEVGVNLFATAFDQTSVDFCMNLGMPAIKIASGDLSNIPLISYAASMGVPIFLSTGGGNLVDVQRAVEEIPSKQLVLMQCTAIYPCPWEKLDLGVIPLYQVRFPEAIVGASLHDNGIAMAVAAYALGARVIEKHFTLDRTMKGTDHAFSLEPQGLKKMVRDLRRAEKAMGGVKTFYPEEYQPIEKMGKSLCAARHLEAGHTIASGDLVALSPGGGFPPIMLEALIGTIITRNLDQEEKLGPADITAPVAFAL